MTDKPPKLEDLLKKFNLTWELSPEEAEGNESEMSLIYVDENDYAFMFYFDPVDDPWNTGWAEGIATRSGFKWDGSGCDCNEDAVRQFEKWLSDEDDSDFDDDYDDDWDLLPSNVDLEDYQDLHCGKD